MAQDFVVLVESGRNDVVAVETNEEMVRNSSSGHALGQSKHFVLK